MSGRFAQWELPSSRDFDVQPFVVVRAFVDLLGCLRVGYRHLADGEIPVGFGEDLA
jgi:hypothetical protein